VTERLRRLRNLRLRKVIQTVGRGVESIRTLFIRRHGPPNARQRAGDRHRGGRLAGCADARAFQFLGSV